MKIQNYINHVAFVIDRSGSMEPLKEEVENVFDEQIAFLAQKSQELKQETRVSVYVFDDNVECLIYDMDVLRLPSLKKYYHIGGRTALIDASLRAIDDLLLTPQLYADHSFLIYVLTDGYENASSFPARVLAQRIASLKENWTLACFVPGDPQRRSALGFGFPVDNVVIWETSVAGISKVGNLMQKATYGYMTARAKGCRGTKNLFVLDGSCLTKRVVQANLPELASDSFHIFPVHKESVIQPFVESWTRQTYRKGSAYYMLTKPETIQSYKQICVQDKMTGTVYGGVNARALLGLPDYEVKVSPENHGKYNIFVQSTSSNRKLLAGTQLLVFKQ